METIDLTKLSSKELAELLKQKKEEERQQSLLNRDAYEAIRAELVQRFEQKTTVLGEEVAGFHQFCVGELSAFRQTMADYGQLRRETQMSFTIQEGNFKIEVKSNKVKKFDERADVAASRLIDFFSDPNAWDFTFRTDGDGETGKPLPRFDENGKAIKPKDYER